MDYTPNFGLRKPGYHDVVNVADLNHNFDVIESEIMKAVRDIEVDENGIYLVTGDGRRVGPLMVGALSALECTVRNSGDLNYTVANGNAAIIRFIFTSTQYGVYTGDGIAAISVNGVLKTTVNVENGSESSVNVAQYLETGENIVSVICTDAYGNVTPALLYSVNVAELFIESDFNQFAVYDKDFLIRVQFFSGIGTGRTIHYFLNGEELDALSLLDSENSIGRVIPAQPHGVHRLTVYLTAIFDGVEKESNHLVYDVICAEPENNQTLISMPFFQTSATQGDLISIPFFVYDPSSSTADITMRIIDENGNKIHEYTRTVDQTKQVWETRVYPSGNITFEIQAGTVKKSVSLAVAQAETNPIVYYYNFDGTVLLYTEIISKMNGDAAYPGRPEKSPDNAVTYTFVGWSTQKNSQTADAVLTNISANKIVYAAYTSSARNYVVSFYNGAELLHRVNVSHGNSVVYPDDTDNLQSSDPLEDGFLFAKWNPEPVNITSDLNCYAQFKIPETITDTWEQIIASCADGTYKNKYKIGDMKIINLGNDEQNVMQIAAIDAEDRSDGSGKVHISWISRYLYGTAHRMSAAATSGGWNASELREWLYQTIRPRLPENVRDAISSVNKSHPVYNSSANSSTQTSSDILWIPSYHELLSGGIYTQVLGTNPVKRKINSAENSAWWLRSESAAGVFHVVPDSVPDSISSDNSASIGSSSDPYVIVEKCAEFLGDTATLTIYLGDAKSVTSLQYVRNDTKATVTLKNGTTNFKVDGNTATINTFKLLYNADSWQIVFSNGKISRFNLKATGVDFLLSESAENIHGVAFGFCL